MEKTEEGAMDDGELEFSERILLQAESASVDSIFDEFMKTTRTCTHTHTCNPPGPNATHTHTCYHTHTRVISSGEEESSSKKHSMPKSKRPVGNREAVRKYREKKKAHTAYLEEEVKKLSMLNQQLLKKLQGHELLEAEVLRLRALLVDIRGKIDGELGVFPFQKPCGSPNFKENCGIQCEISKICVGENVVPSLHGEAAGHGKVIAPGGVCESLSADCQMELNGNVGENLEHADGHFIV